MHRGLLVLVCGFAAVAQTPQRNPLDGALADYAIARAYGRLGEAAGKREEAARLLAQVP